MTDASTRIVVRGREGARDQFADRVHLGLAHAAAGDRRRADADSARDHRRVLIERDGVLVDGDPGLTECSLGDFAGEPLREDVHQHQVIVGAAADQAEPGRRKVRREPLRVGDDLLLVGDEVGLERFFQADSLRRDHVHQRSALDPRERRAIDVLRILRAAQHETAARSAQRLVRRRGDEVGVRHRARMNLRRDQPGDVRHVGDDRGADVAADLADALEIDLSRVGAGADHDHLRLVLVGETFQFFVIDALVVFSNAVRNDRVELAGEVQRMSVRQMAAVRQVHAEDRVARLQQREVHRHVGLRPGVRLHVRVLGAEQLLRARDRQRFGDVDELAAAVVALARISFRVLVREDGSLRLHHRLGDEVLRGDQLEAAVLAMTFVSQHVRDLGIRVAQRPPA